MSQAPNPKKLTDGFISLQNGMDSSKAAALLGPASARVGVNCSFRGGYPHTRPRFRQLSMPGRWQAAGRFNGASTYTDPSRHNPTQIVAAIGRRIYLLDIVAQTERLLAQGRVDTYNYFCQVEKYLVIQNGIDAPLIWDGIVVRSPNFVGLGFGVPVGSIMAYGQGRLFVASPDRRSIIAGDLIYSGHEVAADVVLIVPATGPTAVILTRSQHGLRVGDKITIAGTFSNPSINGPQTVLGVDDKTFSLSVSSNISQTGAGGTVSGVFPADVSDVLRFSETTFLAEGGSFQLPVEAGRITGMIFPPVEDTATGHGDLFVSGEYGAATFQVSSPRITWKEIQFRRIVFLDIGATSPLSFAIINGDFFFRSTPNGIRNYRNSRLAFYEHGSIPVSGELNEFLNREDLKQLTKVSAIEFDNRLLMTALPLAGNLEQPVSYRGIVSLDFNAVSVNFGKSTSAYDGLWTGLTVHQLLAGYFNGQKRAFMLAEGPNEYEDETFYDGFTLYGNKGLLSPSADFSEADVGRSITGSWVPDNSVIARVDTPDTVELNNTIFAQGTGLEFSIHGRAGTAQINLWEILREAGADVKLIAGGPVYVPIETILDTRAFTFQNPMTLKKLLLGRIWLADVVGTVTVSVYFRADQCPTWTPWGNFTAQADSCVYPEDGPCPPALQSKFPGYFPSIRLPTPSEACDPQTNRPLNQGYEFEVRFVMTGLARIVKLVLHALDQVESVAGDCPGILPVQEITACNKSYLDYRVT